MRRFDKYLFGLIIGSTFPLLLSFLTMIAWFYFDKNESMALFYLIGAFVIGLIVDLFFLKSWIRNMYRLPIGAVVAIYLFFNVCIYGMFMGFPVFNIVTAPIAGFYFGNRIRFLNIPEKDYPVHIKQISILTGSVMVLICVSSGFLALWGNGVGSEVQHMLGLKNEVTKTGLLAITLIGGISLIILQIVFARIAMIKALKCDPSECS